MNWTLKKIHCSVSKLYVNMQPNQSVKKPLQFHFSYRCSLRTLHVTWQASVLHLIHLRTCTAVYRQCRKGSLDVVPHALRCERMKWSDDKLLDIPPQGESHGVWSEGSDAPEMGMGKALYVGTHATFLDPWQYDLLDELKQFSSWRNFTLSLKFYYSFSFSAYLPYLKYTIPPWKKIIYMYAL